MNQIRSIKKGLYELAGPQFQSTIDQMRYRLKLLPRVDQSAAGREWLPRPYKAALVISADLEMGWAWRYARSENAISLAKQAATQTRKNFPTLIELFDRYQIPVTWATVGHLFLNQCERKNGRAHPDMPRPPYFENEYWQFQSGDWYDADPCTSLEEAPEWYAPDLIQAILTVKVKHEIACHTFSHIDCSEVNCPPELMQAELLACQEAARPWGLELQSLIFPANYPGNLQVVQKLGFKSYRHHGRYHLAIPEQDEYGLWSVPGGIQLENPPGWRVEDWVKVLCHCVDRALETNTLIHFWFHPSCDPVTTEQVFPQLLETISNYRGNLWIGTMADLVQISVENGKVL